MNAPAPGIIVAVALDDHQQSPHYATVRFAAAHMGGWLVQFADGVTMCVPKTRVSEPSEPNAAPTAAPARTVADVAMGLFTGDRAYMTADEELELATTVVSCVWALVSDDVFFAVEGIDEHPEHWELRVSLHFVGGPSAQDLDAAAAAALIERFNDNSDAYDDEFFSVCLLGVRTVA